MMYHLRNLLRCGDKGRRETGAAQQGNPGNLHPNRLPSGVIFKKWDIRVASLQATLEGEDF